VLKVKYSNSAEKTIEEIADFVEQLNTKGSGERWKERFNNKIYKYAEPIGYSLCRHILFALRNYSCISIGNWIVVFKIINDTFYVYRIINGSILK